MTPRRVVPAVLALALIVAGASLVYLGLSGRDEPAPAVVQAPGQVDAAPATPEATAVPPSDAAIVRLKVERVGIDAPIVVIGVDPDGTMQSPRTPTDVGWYTFSAKPGRPGNVVMAGHVDYINYGPAVFYRLRDLVPGDRVTLTLADGATFAYEIVSLASYDANAPVAEVVGATATETLTLITCTGTFNSRAREYDKRLVVRGLRVTG